MGFTQHELRSIAGEINSTIIENFRNAECKPDVILGNHPALAVTRVLHAITIWHGKRIEKHLSEWISRVSDWKPYTNAKVNLGGKKREIDNLVSNQGMNIVVAVESKRIWQNQDSGSKRDVHATHELYDRQKKKILDFVGLPGAEFRYFVFNAYGVKAKKKKSFAILTGDEISEVFSPRLWSYMEWERECMRRVMLQQLHDQQNDINDLIENYLATHDADPSANRNQVLDAIDSRSLRNASMKSPAQSALDL